MSQSVTRRLVTGSSLSLIDQGLKIVSAFVLTPMIVSGLGDEVYGAWCVLIAVFAQYGWLDLGLGISMPRFFSMALGAKDENKVSTLAATGGIVFFFITIASIVASLTVAWLAPQWFESRDVVQVIRLVVLIMSAFFAMQTASQVHLAYLKGHLRYDLIAAASIVRVICTGALIVVSLRQNWGIVGIAAVHAGVGMMESAIVVRFAHKHRPPLRIDFSHASRAKAVEIFKFASVTYILMAGQNLRNTLDPIIIAAQAGEQAVTAYALGNRFPVLFVDIAHILAGGQLLSLFGRYVGDSDWDGLKKIFAASARMCAVIATFGLMMMWLFGLPFLQRWVPSQAAEAWAVLMPAALPKALFIAQTPSMVLLIAMARHRKLAVIDWVAGLTNVALTWWLSGWMGAPGAAVATCFEQSIVCGMIWPWLAARALGISIAEVWGQLLAGPICRVVLVMAPCFLLVNFVEPDYGVLAGLGLICFVWFVLVSLFVLDEDERRWLERGLPFLRRFRRNVRAVEE
jgi:O-antigen/teichoic acid export membrane protein